MIVRLLRPKHTKLIQSASKSGPPPTTKLSTLKFNSKSLFFSKYQQNRSWKKFAIVAPCLNCLRKNMECYCCPQTRQRKGWGNRSLSKVRWKVVLHPHRRLKTLFLFNSLIFSKYKQKRSWEKIRESCPPVSTFEENNGVLMLVSDPPTKGEGGGGGGGWGSIGPYL